MKLLKIPNSLHFFGITNIEDAKALWKKLQEAHKKTVFRADVEEEYEDHDGNVYSKKTYMDLKKQGIVD